jgi:hypothetical protein
MNTNQKMFEMNRPSHSGSFKKYYIFSHPTQRRQLIGKIFAPKLLMEVAAWEEVTYSKSKL